MSDHRSITAAAKRVLGRDTTTGPERTELPTPGGLFLDGEPVVGAHMRTVRRDVGRVSSAGQAVTEERSVRMVVAVTRAGRRVPFDPDGWARWLHERRTEMGVFR